jgi:hypothetical protein
LATGGEIMYFLMVFLQKIVDMILWLYWQRLGEVFMDFMQFFIYFFLLFLHHITLFHQKLRQIFFKQCIPLHTILFLILEHTQN